MLAYKLKRLLKIVKELQWPSKQRLFTTYTELVFFL